MSVLNCFLHASRAKRIISTVKMSYNLLDVLIQVITKLIMLYIAFFSYDGWKSVLTIWHVNAIEAAKTLATPILSTATVLIAVKMVLDLLINKVTAKKFLGYLVYIPVTVFLAMGFIYESGAKDPLYNATVGIFCPILLFYILASGIDYVGWLVDTYGKKAKALRHYKKLNKFS